MGDIVPVNLKVNINGKYEPRTIYAEEGMTFLFGDKSFIVKKGAKDVVMDAKYYATLGGVSQEVREKDSHNDNFYVLTNSDVANAYKNRNDSESQRALQNHVNIAQDRLGTNARLRTSAETGNSRDLSPREGGLTIHLRDSHNKSAGSISIFKAK